ncbi:MAG: hypothetical protein JWM77_3389 [Rhodospirillales bacterium]|nr:hypothetical protein [Rhodospirillales bacterium]
MTLRMAVGGVMRTRGVNKAAAIETDRDDRLSPRVALLGILGVSTGLWAMLVYAIG